MELRWTDPNGIRVMVRWSKGEPFMYLNGSGPVTNLETAKRLFEHLALLQTEIVGFQKADDEFQAASGRHSQAVFRANAVDQFEAIARGEKNHAKLDEAATMKTVAEKEYDEAAFNLTAKEQAFEGAKQALFAAAKETP
jgi:hypothetical protein